MSFAKRLERALPLVLEMLDSKTNSDVLEAIKFFVVAQAFGLKEAIVGSTIVL